MKLYLAGPMAGLPAYNFPLFDEVTKILRQRGHWVTSPAELTRTTWQIYGTEEQFTRAHPGPEERHQYFLRRDLPAMLDNDAVALLPEWWNSRGATLEALVAKQAGLTLYAVHYSPVFKLRELLLEELNLSASKLAQYHDLTERLHGPSASSTSTPALSMGSSSGATKGDAKESVLAEADRLVDGTRQREYGHPLDNFEFIARLWRDYLEGKWHAQGKTLEGLEPGDLTHVTRTLVNVPLTAEDAAMMMVLLKVTREANQPKRDNRVDGAGYFKVADLIVQERAKRADV